jgi:DNA-binding transcriptional LysR family regulator
MDRLEAMSMLVTVADKGSFSAAARALKVPLATLSRKISGLEEHLGTRLLVRTTRKLSFTDAGLAYLTAARRILDEVEGAEREATGEYTTPKGELVVTAPTFFGRLHVLPVVTDFLALYPEINLRLILADRNVDLIGDHVDMAVRIGKLPDSSMVATPVGQMRTVTCASPALLAGHGIPSQPDDLSQFPCVTVITPMPVPSWRFRLPKSRTMHDVSILPRLAVTTPDAAAQAAIRGVGVARLLHYQVAEAVRDLALQLVLESYEPEPVPIHLLHVSRGQMPLKLRSFIDFAVPRLRAALATASAGER